MCSSKKEYFKGIKIVEDARDDRIFDELALFRDNVMKELGSIKRLLKFSLHLSNEKEEYNSCFPENTELEDVDILHVRIGCKDSIVHQSDFQQQKLHGSNCDNKSNKQKTVAGEISNQLPNLFKTQCSRRVSDDENPKYIDTKSDESITANDYTTNPAISCVESRTSTRQLSPFVVENFDIDEITGPNRAAKQCWKSSTSQTLAKTQLLKSPVSSDTMHVLRRDSIIPFCVESSESDIPSNNNNRFIKEELPLEFVDDVRGKDQHLCETQNDKNLTNAQQIYRNSSLEQEELLKVSKLFHKRNVGTKQITTKKLVECSICQKRFRHVGNLTVHMRKHTGERPFKCSECNKSFYTQSNLKVHTRKHTGERPYHCKVCLKTFIYHSNLLNHIHSHTGATPFACKMCSKHFSSQSLLKSHSRSHR